MDLGGCAAGGNIPAHLLSLGALRQRNIVGFRFAQTASDPAKNKTDITITLLGGQKLQNRQFK